MSRTKKQPVFPNYNGLGILNNLGTNLTRCKVISLQLNETITFNRYSWLYLLKNGYYHLYISQNDNPAELVHSTNFEQKPDEIICLFHSWVKRNQHPFKHITNNDY